MSKWQENLLKIGLPAILVAAILVATLLVGGTRDTGQAKSDPQTTSQGRQGVIDRCLFSAVDAYPSWGNATPVLDAIDPCKGMPQEDRTLLRRMLADFVTAVNQRSLETTSPATPTETGTR